MATNSSAVPPPGLTVHIGTVEDLVPCCYISESEWTWLGCTMLCVR